MKLKDLSYSNSSVHQKTVEIIINLYTSGVITLNEARDFFGLSHIEGGDKVVSLFVDSVED